MPQKNQQELERRFIPLAEFRVDDTDPRGTFSGYGNVKGVIDAYGSIFADGSYESSIPSLLENGFVPDTHAADSDFIYTILGAYGYFTELREDPKGLFTKGIFHSDPEAQVIRTRSQERAADKKSVGMSIGFNTISHFYIQKKDYNTELIKYLKPEYYAEGMKIAQNFPQIEIKTEVKIYEISLTLMPANDKSLVTQINSAQMNMNELAVGGGGANGTVLSTEKTKEGRSKYLGNYTEENANMAALCSVLNDLYYNVYYTVVYCETMTVEERTQMLSDALDEFKEINLAIFSIIAKWDAVEDAQDMEALRNDLRAVFTDPKDLLPITGLNKKELGQRAITALSSYIGSAISRTKLQESQKAKGIRAGKVLSDENYSTLKTLSDEMKTHHESLGGCMSMLDDFLSKYAPSDKGNGSQPNEDDAMATELNNNVVVETDSTKTASLRTRLLRLKLNNISQN